MPNGNDAKKSSVLGARAALAGADALYKGKREINKYTMIREMVVVAANFCFRDCFAHAVLAAWQVKLRWPMTPTESNPHQTRGRPGAASSRHDYAIVYKPKGK